MVVDWRVHGFDVIDKPVAFAPRPLTQIPVTKPPPGLLASPASLWTAVATGRSESGVGALEEKRPMGLSSPVGVNVPLGDLLPSLLPGRKVAVSAGVRTARTLWEILHDHEGVGSIGWWATWPAVDRGTAGIPFDLITDRALFALRRPSEGDLLIAPPALERRVNGEFESDLAELRSRRRWSYGTPEINLFSLAAGEENRADLEQAAVIDGYAATLALKLLADFRVRNLFVYLPGVDIARVAVAKRTPEKADRFVWWYADYAWAQTQRIERALKPEDTLVLIATPGRRDPLLAREALIESWPKPPPPMVMRFEKGEGWSEEEKSRLRDAQRDFETRLANARASNPWGCVLIWGPLSPYAEAPNVGASAGVEMSVLDISPTLLNLRGFPVSREMEGRSLVRFADEKQRPAPIDSYGRNTLPSIPFSASSEENERETLERLRSLGYLN